MKTIELTQNQVAYIDNEDYNKISKYNWGAHKKKGERTYYARTKINGKYVSMHRFILDLGAYRPLVDHINNNGLDNRKENLRLVTDRQNAMNSSPRRNCTSKYKGVSWHKRDKRWEVYIWPKKGKRIYLGGSKDEETAARMYNEAATKYFGEYAYLNKIDG